MFKLTMIAILFYYTKTQYYENKQNFPLHGSEDLGMESTNDF